MTKEKDKLILTNKAGREGKRKKQGCSERKSEEMDVVISLCEGGKPTEFEPGRSGFESRCYCF